jgi:hypothetical protein
MSDLITETNGQPSRRPFRAADVLTGTIDQRRPAATRSRKQISAQLDPNQLRILGELHARLNATADKRIEKSDLVGLGIELLAAVLKNVDGERWPAGPEGEPAPHRVAADGRRKRQPAGEEIRDVADIRSYLRTHVRAYAEK